MAQLPTYPSSISFASLASTFGGAVTRISLGDYYARYSLIDISSFDSRVLATASASHVYNTTISASLIFYPDGIYEVKTAGPSAVSGFGTQSTGNWSPLGNANAYYTGTIVISPGLGGVYPGSGPSGGMGGNSTAKYAGVLLTGGLASGGQNSNTGNNYGSGGSGSYALDSGVVLANPAGVQTVTGGNGGQDNGNFGGAGGGAPNGAVGASPNFGGYSTGGAGGYAAEWNGIRAALTIVGANGNFGYGGAGATRTTTPGGAGGYGGGGGGTASVSNLSPASGGSGIVLVQYTAAGTTSTQLYTAATSLTLPPKCSNLKIWVCGGGGGAGPSSGGAYAGGGGGGGGMAYYEWLSVSPTATGIDTSIYSIKWEVASVSQTITLGAGASYSGSGGFVSMASTQTITVQIPTPAAPNNVANATVYYNIYIAETANTATIIAAAHNVALTVTSS